MRQRFASCLALLFALAASSASAQSSAPLEVELGYRWTDVGGNEDLYRTQINEQNGFVLRTLTFFSSDFDGPNRGMLDSFRIDATDLSNGPASALRIEAAKAGMYRLRIGYRSFDVLSALPNFANPLIEQGIVPGQHTWDRTRRLFDAEVELVPWTERFTPFIGYSYSKYDGPGTTTYTLGGDDYKLASDLDEAESEFRIGTSFNTGSFHGSFTQGWRNLGSTERLTLSADSHDGNVPFPILGRDLSAGAITRNSDTDSSTPFTSVSVGMKPVARVRIAASWATLSADADTDDLETAAGSFLSFPLAGFFGGTSEQTTSDARNRSTRGDLRFEIDASEKVALMAAYRRQDRELRGTAVIHSLFEDFVTFGGVSRGAIQEGMEARSRFDRAFDEIEAGANFRPVQRLTLRVSVSEADYDYDIDPDSAEITLPGGQGGQFSRTVQALSAQATWASRWISANVSFRNDDADRPVLRTDFLNRSRFRGRVGFQTPGQKLRVSMTGEHVEQDNLADQTAFDANVDEFGIDAEFSPVEMIRVRGGISRVEMDSTVRIRRPESFALDTSVHEEQWDAKELGFALVYKKLTLESNASWIGSEGTLPYDAERYQARAAWDLKENLGIAGEWAHDQYDENAAGWGRFDADRFGVFIRYRR